MCCTSSPSVMSDTLIYTGLAAREGKRVHVLAYQNVALNKFSGPNSMILPFPTSEKMTEDNIIDTSSFKHFLRDITNASKIRSMMLGGGSSRSLLRGAKSAAKVFDVGSYTVVLADDVWQVSEALERVPENKRPTITEEFLIGYSALYPDQPLAVCCWDGRIEAEPLLWWYEPKNTDHFFIPTMDAHDGNAPKLSETVRADHNLSVGAASDAEVGNQFRVTYRDKIPADVREMLPNYTYGTKIDYNCKNGDMFVKTDDLAVGNKTWNFDKLPKMVRGSSHRTAFDSKEKITMYGWS